MVYPITKRIIPPILSSIFIKKVKGIENLQKKGAYILASSHASHLDQYFILCLAIPYLNRKIHVFADEKIWFRESMFKRWWSLHYEAIPICREGDTTPAINKATDYLKKGEIVLIYPEGGRSTDGNLKRGKTGAALLALISKVPVIPISLKNTIDILPKGKRFPKFKKKVEIYFGTPIYFDKYYGRENEREVLREVTTIIMNEIAKLAKQDYPYDKSY